VGNGRKFDPQGPSTPPEWAGREAWEIAEASESAARSARSDAAAARPLARLGAGLRSAAIQAAGPSDPKRRSFPDPGNRAEASAGDASGSASAGAPSPAPPEFGGAAAATTPARLGPILSSGPAAKAWGARHARDAETSEDRRGQVAAPSAPALPAPVGADGSPAPADAGAGGTPAKLGPTAWLSPSAHAREAGHAEASEYEAPPAFAARSTGPASRTPIGADGRPAPADAGAQSDPKHGPHGGVRDGAEDRKPEGAAPETHGSGANPPALLPSAGRLSGRLAALAETAKAYARAAQSDNTQRAYAADWKMFASWLRRQGLAETPPDPEAVGLYLAAQAERGGAELSVATLERRLSGIAWRYRQLGVPLEIRDRHIATVLAGIRRRHARPPLQKAAIFADELLAMLATLDMDLRGLRDRAILAIGFAGGLRRSEIVGLDCGPDQSEDGSGWIEIVPEGALVTIRGKTGWREVEIGRGSRPDTCPVALLETWLRLGRISHGPLFRAIARKNGGVSGERLTDKHVVRLVQKCALVAGLRGDLAEGERRLAFGGHSLRAGLASSAQIEEAHVQKHLGHASAEMTRRYQRKRDRFKINLTKAAGL
jgi:integrase